MPNIAVGKLQCGDFQLLHGALVGRKRKSRLMRLVEAAQARGQGAPDRSGPMLPLRKATARLSTPCVDKAI